MNLTEAQKSKLENLNAARKKAHAEKVEAQKAAKRSNDSVRVNERRQMKLDYLREVKEIIGPDNYVVFLENQVINQGGKPNNHKTKGMRFESKRHDNQKHASAYSKQKRSGNNRSIDREK